jgi:hypothetical protein
VMSSMKTSSIPASVTAITPVQIAHRSSKCEFGFCRKGLCLGAEIQLAVGHRPVYTRLRQGFGGASPRPLRLGPPKL